mmetsp:Transcript_2530/g.3213  ORF Transcript_2530/g.3213 Transcript_2530/m.3213 type:complete len:362 (+) Transcript_2530:562-1647(+)
MWGQFVDIEKEYLYSCRPFTRTKWKKREKSWPGHRLPSSDISITNKEQLNDSKMSTCKSTLPFHLPQADSEILHYAYRINHLTESKDGYENEDSGIDEFDSEYEEDEPEGIDSASSEYEEAEVDKEEQNEKSIAENTSINRKGFYTSIKKICWNSSRNVSPCNYSITARRKRSSQRRYTEVLPDSRENHVDESDCCKVEKGIDAGNKFKLIRAFSASSISYIYDADSETETVREIKIGEPSEDENETANECCSPLQCIYINAQQKMCSFCRNQPKTIEYTVATNEMENENDGSLFLSEAELVSVLIALHPKAANCESIALKLKAQFVNAKPEKKNLVLAKLKPQHVLKCISKIRSTNVTAQ